MNNCKESYKFCGNNLEEEYVIHVVEIYIKMKLTKQKNVIVMTLLKI